MLFEEKTELIIKCFYQVYNYFGYGFLEKVYENALIIELNRHGFWCHQQCAVEVCYKDIKVGNYYCDILVDNKIILELKTAEIGIVKEHEIQLLNYLRATELELGLILNFGKTPSIKRKINTRNFND